MKLRKTNEIDIRNNFAFIHLYNNKNQEVAETKIDIEFIDLIKNNKWYLRPDGYVATNNYNGKYTYLHKLILNNTTDYVDHRDRNKLNNTKENLRQVDCSENQMNKGIRSNNTSGKVGVHFSKDKNKWCAMICVRKKHINLGYFEDFQDAVKCRLDAEIKYFGQYRANNEIAIPTLD